MIGRNVCANNELCREIQVGQFRQPMKPKAQIRLIKTKLTCVSKLK